MNSPDHPPKHWDALITQARQAQPPADVDMRFSIRAALTPHPSAAPAPGLLDEVLALGRASWMRTGFACGLAFAAWSCWQGAGVVQELSALWSVAGPLMAQL